MSEIITVEIQVGEVDLHLLIYSDWERVGDAFSEVNGLRSQNESSEGR